MLMQLSTRSTKLNSGPVYLAGFVAGTTTFSLQVLVFRAIELTIGASAVAFSITLALYMFGMSIGAFLHSHPSQSVRLRNLPPLFAVHMLQALTAGGFWLIHSRGQSLPWLLVTILIGVLGFGAAIAAGAIFPGLSAILPARKRPTSIIRVYGANIVGGAAGVAWTVFVGIERLGIGSCILTSAFISVLLAVIFLLLFRTQEISSRPTGESADNATIKPFYIFVAFSLGLAGLGLEVAVFRVLTPVMGLSIYSLAGTLIPFLLGLGLGGVFAANFTGKAAKTLPWIGLSAVVAFSLLLYLVEFLPGAMAWMAWNLTPDITSWWAILIARFGLSSLVLVPGAVLAGMMFPLLLSMLLEDQGYGGSVVGTIYSMNILGSVLGPLLVNLLLVKWLGVYWAFRSLLLVYLVIAAGFFVLSSPNQYRKPLFIAAASVAIFLAAFPYHPDLLNVHAGTYWGAQLYREALPGPSLKLINRKDNRKKVLAGFDGPVASVLVVQEPSGRSLIIDGKPASNTLLDRPTQIMLARIPLEAMAEAKKVLVIGWGSGQTVNEVLRYPVEEVVCVEISREVLKAAGWFSEVNSRALTDPRLSVVVGDARSYLARTKDKFDLIISQPSNPWVGFSGSLFTREFMAMCREALTPGGMMAQWFQYYGATASDMDIFLRTWSAEFDNWGLWSPSTGDLVLLGLPDSSADLQHRAKELDPLAASESFQPVPGPLNTDDRPLLSYSMARHVTLPKPLVLASYLGLK